MIPEMWYGLGGVGLQFAYTLFKKWLKIKDKAAYWVFFVASIGVSLAAILATGQWPDPMSAAEFLEAWGLVFGGASAVFLGIKFAGNSTEKKS